ncbi:MAG: CTP synthase, partial [Patescibacteria group bacterium]
EAARMLKQKKPGDVAIVMLSYVPIPGNIGEMKTKPTQHASRELNSVGLQADLILARATVPLDEKRKEKIATFCNVLPERVISAPDVESIYDVPINFEKDGLGNTLCTILGLPQRPTDFSDWNVFIEKMRAAKETLPIAVVGKYFNSGDFVLSDVYISVLEALKTAGYYHGKKIQISYVSSQDFETGKTPLSKLDEFAGVLIPGGFGETGIEGKIKVIQYVREQKIPYFGLCYGMQLAVVEYARNMANLPEAHTTEIKPDTPTPVIAVMDSQKENVAQNKLGGTMRLGGYPCKLKEGTIAYEAYGKGEIRERHRHRYEVNPKYVKQIEDAGLVFSGTLPDGSLMEIAELPREVHPFFLGTQFHPELLSRPLHSHPLFLAFIKAAKENKK